VLQEDILGLESDLEQLEEEEGEAQEEGGEEEVGESGFLHSTICRCIIDQLACMTSPTPWWPGCSSGMARLWHDQALSGPALGPASRPVQGMGQRDAVQLTHVDVNLHLRLTVSAQRLEPSQESPVRSGSPRKDKQ